MGICVVAATRYACSALVLLQRFRNGYDRANQLALPRGVVQDHLDRAKPFAHHSNELGVSKGSSCEAKPSPGQRERQWVSTNGMQNDHRPRGGVLSRL